MKTSAIQPSGVARYYSEYTLSQNIINALKSSDYPKPAFREVIQDYWAGKRDAYGVIDLIQKAFKMSINPEAPNKDVSDDIWYVSERVGDYVRADDDDRIPFLNVLRDLREKYPRKKMKVSHLEDENAPYHTINIRLAYADKHAGVDIPNADLMKAVSELEKIVKKYKKYEGGTTSSPSAPDTSKFMATHSGFLQVGYGGYPLVLGLKIGTNFYPVNYNSPNRNEEFAKRTAFIDKIKAEADKVLIPFRKKHSLGYGPEYKYGTNFSIYGFVYSAGVSIV